MHACACACVWCSLTVVWCGVVYVYTINVPGISITRISSLEAQTMYSGSHIYCSHHLKQHLIIYSDVRN